MDMTNEEIVKAIHNVDLKRLSLDMVDILLTILPNDQEVQCSFINLLVQDDNF